MAGQRSVNISSRSQTATIERLESDLFMARRAIVELMGPEAKRILLDLRRGQSLGDLCDQADVAARDIMALCHPQASEEMGDSPGKAPRSECPLCCNGSENLAGVRGFAVPEGLMRHLLGSHNSRQCDVFAAAYALARDSLEGI